MYKIFTSKGLCTLFLYMNTTNCLRKITNICSDIASRLVNENTIILVGAEVKQANVCHIENIML